MFNFYAFIFKITLAIVDSLHFHIRFRIIFLISLRTPCWNFIEIVLNLLICLWKIDIYTITNFIQQLECLSTILVFFKCPSVNLRFYSYLAYFFFRLCWVFVATHGLSLVVACGAQTLEHAGSVTAVLRLGCPAARGVLFP